LNRIDIAAIANERGVKRAVEVGTDRGIFARDFLQKWHGEMLLCIDPWEPYPEMTWDRTGDLILAANVLAPFADRVRLVRGTSEEALKEFHWFKPGLVYIDGAHTYESVKADILTWWPQIPSGGILSGHDYDETHPGVRKAVDEFLSSLPSGSLRGQLVVTRDYNFPPSWFVEKR